MEEQLDYYHFWAWEYTKRNRNVEVIRNEMKLRSVEGFRVQLHIFNPLFIEFYGYDLSLFDNLSKKEIVNKLEPRDCNKVISVLSRKQKLIPAIRRMFKEINSVILIDHKEQLLTFNVTSKCDIGLATGLFKIQMQKNKIWGSTKMSLRTKSLEYKILEYEEEYVCVHNRMKVKSLIRKSLHRAIGLWLWDYVNRPLYRKNPTVNEAIKAFRVKYPGLGLESGNEDQDIDDRTFKHLFEHAEECVDINEVLALTNR